MNLKEDLMNLKSAYEKEYVVLFNDGTTEKINGKKFEEIKNDDIFAFCPITYEFKKAYQYFADKYPYIYYINMDMKMGILFDINDFNQNGELKENAQPVKDYLYFYSKDITLHDSKIGYVPSEAYNYDRLRRIGVIKFEEMLEECKANGIDYNGPLTFNEYVSQIIDGESFKVDFSLNLKTYDQEYDEAQIEQEEISEEPKKRRRFFR